MMINGGIPKECTVAIVGGGTSGLALGTALRKLGVGHVIVLERETKAGGIPRHCGHYPFGIREYKCLMKGPDYAQKNIDEAVKNGVDIRTGVTVTALHKGGILNLSTASGLAELQAQRVVLCTGVRESNRWQRGLAGDRPLGVLSTGALQSLVYLCAMRPFQNPVIFGSELVSFSAIGTCKHAGIRPIAMIEEGDRILAQKYLQPYLTLSSVPLHVGVKTPRIIGRERVEAIEFIDAKGIDTTIQTDGVILSGHFRPEAALLQASHLEVDRYSGGPVIDQFGQCSDPAYYCAGNLLRPAETSGWCWREGTTTAQWIADELSGADCYVSRSVKLQVADPKIGFAVPQRVSITNRTGGKKTIQISLLEPVKGTLQAVSQGHTISSLTIHSRPIRRIQMPLQSILSSQLTGSVELSIKKVH